MGLRSVLKHFNAVFTPSRVILVTPYTVHGTLENGKARFSFSDGGPGEKPSAPVYQGYATIGELQEFEREGLIAPGARFFVLIDERLILNE